MNPGVFSVRRPRIVLSLIFIVIVGGIIGAVLLLALFDWALIVMSSVVGAYLIGLEVTLPPTGATLLFVGLALIGIVVQASAFRGRAAVQ